MLPPDTSPEAESQCIAQISAGDTQAFVELYDRFAAPLYALALRITQHAEDSEEALQQAFVEVWNKAIYFQPERAPVFTWLAMITRAKAVERAGQRQRRLRLCEEIASQAPLDLARPPDAAAAATELSGAAPMSAIQQGLAQLPEEQRAPIELAFFRGLTQGEMAEELSAPLAAIKARIRRGMLRLRDSLEPRVPLGVDEAQQERAALYALGVLGNAEIVPFEEKMRIDPELSHLVRDLQNAAASLARAVPPAVAPEYLRARVLEAVQQQQKIAEARDQHFAALRASRGNELRFWSGWAIAVLLAVLLGALARQRLKLQRQVAESRTQSGFGALQIATLTSKPDEGRIGVGVVVWDPASQQGFLSVEKLPPLAPDQDYQLWVTTPQAPQPLSGGVVPVDAEGSAKLTFELAAPIQSAEQFAISRERRGGVPTGEGPKIMLSNKSSQPGGGH